MIDESLINAVSSIGVPAVLALYCLITLNKTVDNLSRSVDKMTDRIDTLMKIVTTIDKGGRHAA